MSLVPHPTKGPGWWRIRISRGRNRPQLCFSFQGTRAEAEIYHAELKRAYRPGDRTPVCRPLRDLVPDFLAHYQTVVSPTTLQSWIRAWKHLDRHFGAIYPQELTQLMISRYKQERVSTPNGRGGTVSRRTVNKELSYLAALISWCASEESGPLIDPLPFRITGFPGRQTRPPIPHILTPEQADRLITELKPPLRGLVACLYYAGLRFTEAATLKADHIDWERKLLIVKGKGGKERIVPILPALEELLPRHASGLLFPNRQGEPYRDIRTALRYAARRAGITQHVHPHLLRHTFGAHAIRDMNLRAVQIIMGHSTPAVTQRYTQISEQGLAEEMARFRLSAPATTKK